MPPENGPFSEIGIRDESNVKQTLSPVKAGILREKAGLYCPG